MFFNIYLIDSFIIHDIINNYGYNSNYRYFYTRKNTHV